MPCNLPHEGGNISALGQTNLIDSHGRVTIHNGPAELPQERLKFRKRHPRVEPKQYLILDKERTVFGISGDVKTGLWAKGFHALFFARLEDLYLSKLGHKSGGSFDRLPEEHMVKGLEDRGQSLSNVSILKGGRYLWVDFRIDAYLDAQISQTLQKAMQGDLICTDRKLIPTDHDLKGIRMYYTEEEDEQRD